MSDLDRRDAKVLYPIYPRDAPSSVAPLVVYQGGRRRRGTLGAVRYSTASRITPTHY